jgi:hypothetical protein
LIGGVSLSWGAVFVVGGGSVWPAPLSQKMIADPSYG